MRIHIHTESKDTRVVDLRLDEGRRVEVHLRADLKRDVALRRRTGVVDSLGTSLNIARDAVVVARGEGVEVVQTVHGNGVLGSRVANGSGEARDLAIGNVILLVINWKGYGYPRLPPSQCVIDYVTVVIRAGMNSED